MAVNRAIQNGEIFEVYYEYSVRLTTVLRCLPGWAWSKEKKCGVARATPAARALLKKLEFEVDDDPTEFDFGEAPSPNDNHANVWEGEVRSPYFASLRRYQQEGVRRIIGAGGRALLADEMGLGKTPQALTWLEHLDGSPAFVVTTASTKSNWKEEASRWTTRKTEIVNGTKPYPLPPADLYVLNYHIVDAWLPVLQKMRAVALVADEAHNIKNKDAVRTKAVKALAKRVPQFLALTGTPIMSNPIEMFTVLQLINKNLFPSRVQFGLEFCQPEIDPWSGSIVYKGVTNADVLKKKLADIMVRRLKADVLSELPPKQRTRVELEIDNRGYYDKVAAAKPAVLSSMSIKAKLQELLALTAHGKFAAACAWIDDVLAQGEKLFVGVHHVAVAQALLKQYGKAAVGITGSTPVPKRQAICDAFNRDPSVRLMFGELEAAGEGLNLQHACSNVAFFEYPWTPARLVQFEDRVHRFGQQQGVNVWFLTASNTVEEKLIDTLLSKADVVSSALDEDTSTDSTVKELWRFLSKA